MIAVDIKGVGNQETAQMKSLHGVDPILLTTLSSYLWHDTCFTVLVGSVLKFMTRQNNIFFIVNEDEDLKKNFISF